MFGAFLRSVVRCGAAFFSYGVLVCTLADGYVLLRRLFSAAISLKYHFCFARRVSRLNFCIVRPFKNVLCRLARKRRCSAVGANGGASATPAVSAATYPQSRAARLNFLRCRQARKVLCLRLASKRRKKKRLFGSCPKSLANVRVQSVSRVLS